ncbi:uncharacterized protein [Cherax quadricarinatus]|uniref:uncharacterized protein n=1 Tax=Cherax quadricarinatus TaxID=27406 RepID=UPI002378C82F|nr:uncharacterized protein LOC128692635 [Cherax quadricarinatus]
MPPVKKLNTLRDMSMERVWRWLFQCVRCPLASGNHRIPLRKYLLSSLCPLLRQRLLTLIFNVKRSKLFIDTKCKLLQVLGDDTTHYVDFTQGGSAFIEEMMHFYNALNVASLFNLTRLGAICDVRHKTDQRYISTINKTFYLSLEKMRNLRWLTLGGICDTIVMKILGTNCRHLQHLDISDSLTVNDEGVAALVLSNSQALQGLNPQEIGRQTLPLNPCCSTLSFVCVSGTQVGGIGAALLLHCLPGLTSLGSYPITCSLTRVIELLQPEEGLRQFKLNKMWDADILPHQATLLSIACPDVTAIFTHEASLPSLHFLFPFEYLSVDIDFKYSVNSLYNYLVIRGETLKQLILVDSINCPLDLTWLVELTPNLERIEATLEVKHMAVTQNWNVLSVATVTVDSSITIINLLTRTPNLRSLELTFLESMGNEETYRCINDELLLRILTAGGLKKVEKLKISQCMISTYGLDCLLQYCPDLQYLAPLVCWPNITRYEVDKLLAKTAENNWLLRIVMRTDWE